MIRLCGQSELPILLEQARHYLPAGIRIHTLAQMAEVENGASPETLFWLISREDKITGALARSGGILYLSAPPEADIDADELMSFCRGIGGLSHLEAPPRLLRGLFPPERIAAGDCMACPKAPPAPGGIPVREASVRDTYRLICAVEHLPEEDPAWSPWYVFLSRLIRRGPGLLRGVYEGGALAAAGGIYAANGDCALIGGVAALPEFRGRGFASAIVAELCRAALAGAKTPLLLCKPGLAGFYEKLGFERCGEWAEAELRYL